jgi:hypothetical protein
MRADGSFEPNQTDEVRLNGSVEPNVWSVNTTPFSVSVSVFLFRFFYQNNILPVENLYT